MSGRSMGRMAALAVCGWLLAAGTARAQALGGYHIILVLVQLDGETYDVSVKWDLELLAEVTQTTDASAGFSLEVGGIGSGSVFHEVLLMSGASPSLCPSGSCNGTSCGATLVAQQAVNLVCSSEDGPCRCALPEMTTTLATGLRIPQGAEITVRITPGPNSHPGIAGAEGSFILGSHNRRIRHIEVRPNDRGTVDLVGAIDLSFAAPHSAPIDLSSIVDFGVIPDGLTVTAGTTLDYPACCQEVCKCCSNGLLDCNDSETLTDTSVSGNSALFPSSCSAGTPQECGEATDNGKTEVLICDPQTGECTSGEVVFRIENVPLRRGDRVGFSLSPAPGALPDPDPIDNVVVLGTCPDSCDLDGTVCQFDGLTNTAVTAARLSIDGNCNLHVGNIGSTGEDGVRIAPLPRGAQLASMGWAPPNLTLFQPVVAGSPNAFLLRFALGPTPTAPDYLELEIVADQWDFNPAIRGSFDFAAVKPVELEVEYKEGGQNVFTHILPGAAQTDVLFKPTELKVTKSVAWCPETETYQTGFVLSAPTEFLVPTQRDPVMADEVVVIARGASVLLPALLEVEILSRNVPFTIASEFAGAKDARECNDRDGDGYGVPGSPLCREGGEEDCNDEEPAIHPGAEEICNGEDDDCDGFEDEGFDPDEDGYPVCLGDCAPNNPNVNPLAEEVCDNQRDDDCDELIDDADPDCDREELCDGVDDDMDGATDEGFTWVGVDQDPKSPWYGILRPLPIGAVCVAGEGECEAVGMVVCAPDQVSAICNAATGKPGTEGPVGDPTCFDILDNDCDGLDDHEDPDCTSDELCDNFDNDNDGLIDEDFPDRGQPCTAGIGMCEQTGLRACREDGTGTECDATPSDPFPEMPPGGFRCTDERDNDCDGLVDLADPDCQEPEKCDGKDNDGDGQVDEDFIFLGLPCTRGLGACERSGKIVCSADGSTTVCDAVPLSGFYEGPGNCSCSDGIDNDCDNLTDQNDPSCSSAALIATCALVPCKGNDPADCVHTSRVEFGATGGTGDIEVSAQLIGIQGDGDLVGAVPVQNGDTVRLSSRVNPLAWDVSTTETAIDLSLFESWEGCETGPENGPISAGCETLDTDCDTDIDLKDYYNLQNAFGGSSRLHVSTAPIPFVMVRADDGLNQALAFCSNTPFAAVFEPDTLPISESEGDFFNVTASIAGVDPDSLQVRIDGVPVFPLIGVDPVPDFPGGPYQGYYTTSTQVGGARIVEICDLWVRRGEIHEHSPNSLTMTVRNLGCGGHRIVVDGDPQLGFFPNPVPLNCFEDDVLDDGIVETLGVEILEPGEGDITPGPPTEVIARACHGDQIARLFLNGAEFPTGGQVLFPGDGVNTTDSYVLDLDTDLPETDLRAELDGAPPQPGTLDFGGNRIHAKVRDGNFLTSHDSRIVVVGPAVPAPGSTAFTAAGASLDDLSEQVAEQVAAAIAHQAVAGGPTVVDNAFALAIEEDALDTIFCEIYTVVAETLKERLEMELPGTETEKKTIDLKWPLCDPKVGMTILEVMIDVTDTACEIEALPDRLRIKLTLPAFQVRVNVNGGCKRKFLGVCVVKIIVDADADFEIGNLSVTLEIDEQAVLNQDLAEVLTVELGEDPVPIEGTINNRSDVKCLVGFILDILNFLLKVITFGLWDPNLDKIEFNTDSQALKEKIGEKGGDMRDLPEFSFDNEEMIENFKAKLGHFLSDFNINAQGVSVGVRATFEPTEIDPAVADVPGTPLTPAPLPAPPVPGAGNMTAMISDDVFNQLLSSLTKSGAFHFEAQREIGDYLPNDCGILDINDEGPRCVGITGGDCNQFVLAIRRERCEDAKARWEDRLLTPGTLILVEGNVDVPPKLLIDDDPATPDRIEVLFRFSQFSTSLIADRDGDGILSGNPASLPNCFDDTPGTENECALWESCLNVNVLADLRVPADALTLIPSILDIDVGLSTGAMCGGGDDEVGEDLIDGSAADDVLMLFNQFIEDKIPSLDTTGLEFGGLFTFQNIRLIAVETNGDPDFADYIGLTTDVTPAGP